MPLAQSVEHMQRGIQRLLLSPLTLEQRAARVWASAPDVPGSVRHRQLFAEYTEEVDFVTAVALQWWEETVHAREAAHVDGQRALHAAWIDRPAGPASYPGIVALVRDYWLECDRLNHEVDESERVPPWVFLLGWLLTGEYEQCVSVLACMPYWPIGLDADGQWV